MILSDLQVYNPQKFNLEKRYNIGFGISEVFGRPLGVSLTSVLENNKILELNIHIFFDNLLEDDILRLKRTADKYNQVIFFHKIKYAKDIFKNVKTDMKIWQATYYRLIAVSAMPKYVDYLLWLDSDICCTGSLKEIFDLNLGKYPIAAVAHAEQKGIVAESIKRLNLISGKYFNAGIIYFNLKEWNKRNFSDKSYDMIKKPKEEWKLYDQDMFNTLIDGDFYELDYIYNFQRLGGCKKYKAIPDDLKIFHFVGPEKPWYKYKSEFQEAWLKYSEISEWKDIPLLVPEKKPENASYFRYMSRAEIHDKNYILAIKYYFEYLRLKLYR